MNKIFSTLLVVMGLCSSVPAADRNQQKEFLSFTNSTPLNVNINIQVSGYDSYGAYTSKATRSFIPDIEPGHTFILTEDNIDSSHLWKGSERSNSYTTYISPVTDTLTTFVIWESSSKLGRRVELIYDEGRKDFILKKKD